jgi:hypothetical protein
MRRNFRVLTFKRATGQYLSLVVEWQEGPSNWRSRVVRSYGAPVTAETRAQAEADRQELQRLAGDEKAPIPIGTLNDAVWAGLRETLANPMASLPALPFLAVRDLAHLGGYVLAQLSGGLEQKVAATQPQMPAEERDQVVAWLASLSPEDQALALAYQWRMQP